MYFIFKIGVFLSAINRLADLENINQRLPCAIKLILGNHIFINETLGVIFLETTFDPGSKNQIRSYNFLKKARCGCSSVAECLPTMWEALVPSPSITTKQNLHVCACACAWVCAFRCRTWTIQAMTMLVIVGMLMLLISGK